MSLKLGTGKAVFAFSFLMTAVLLATPALRAEMQITDPRYFTIDAVQIEEVELSDAEASELLGLDVAPSIPTPVPPLPTPMPAPFPAPGTGTPVPGSDYGTGVTDVTGQIVNLAKSLWDIVVENRPVVNIAIDNASALPVGVTAWTQLSSWQVPKGKAYRVNYMPPLWTSPSACCLFRVES